MNTVRCPVCRRMYEFSGMPPEYCPECYLREEELYQKVRSLVKKYPGITMLQAAEITGVPQRKIMRYIREERLEAIPTSTVFLQCLSCGKVINTGSYCVDCRRQHGDSESVELLSKTETELSFDKNKYNVENKIDERSEKDS